MDGTAAQGTYSIGAILIHIGIIHWEILWYNFFCGRQYMVFRVSIVMLYINCGPKLHWYYKHQLNVY